MLSVRRADTAGEFAIRRLLFARGLRYRKDFRPLRHLRTKADIAFIGARVAIYVDGCFWHACPQHATWPKNNASFWKKKIRENVERDRRVDAALSAAGWLVIRIWEHQDPGEAADLVEEALRRREAEISS